MNITIYYPVKIPVTQYGGTERVMYWLMKALCLKKHTVTLIGHPDSQVSDIGVTLIPFIEGDWRTYIPKNTDILHTAQNSLDIEIPYVNTIHGNEPPGTVLPQNSIFVSQNHAIRHHASAYVYNGIDFDEYPLIRNRLPKNANYLFLANGRWPVKNLSDCIRAVRSAKKRLTVCGSDRKGAYRVQRKIDMHPFEAALSTLSPRITYKGMTAQSEKLPIMKDIDFLLWPVRWHEPFGLAIIEAFSQGIPVYASSYGSLPELVDEGSGNLFSSYEEFAAAVLSKENTYNPQYIRQRAIELFSSSAMVTQYEIMYEKVISGLSLNESNPYCDDIIDPVQLLPF